MPTDPKAELSQASPLMISMVSASRLASSRCRVVPIAIPAFSANRISADASLVASHEKFGQFGCCQFQGVIDILQICRSL